MTMKIGILNGPNLNRLGTREPEKYGSQTLADLIAELDREAARLGVEIGHFQSNTEGLLVDQIHSWADAGFSGLIVNAGAYTHTSVALRDAIAATSMTAVEVHISNVFAREDFRHHSFLAPVCAAAITGLGFEGYLAAMRFIHRTGS